MCFKLSIRRDRYNDQYGYDMSVDTFLADASTGYLRFLRVQVDQWSQYGRHDQHPRGGA